MGSRFFEQGLARVTGAPRLVLAAATLLALAGVALAPTLRFSSSRFELIGADPELDAFLARYGSPSDLVAVIDATDAAPVDELAARVERLPEVARVLSRIDTASLEGRELTLLPPDDLEGLLFFLEHEDPSRPLDVHQIVEEARARLEGGGDADLDALEEAPDPVFDGAAGLGFLLRLLESLSTYLEQDGHRPPSFGPGLDQTRDHDGYFVSDDGNTYYLFVSLVRSSDRYDEVAPTVAAVRDAAREVMRAHPEVRVAWTGYPAIAVDEVDAIRRGSVLTGILAALLVMALFAYAFRSAGAFLIAALPLAIGVAWAFGMIALSVGELNLLTQVAAPVFLGLGIDFSIHLLAAYERAQRDGEAPACALVTAWTGTGRGVVAGGLTTAAAFLALTVTEQPAFRELGLVTGVGLLLTMLSILVVTPALLTLGEQRGISWLQVRPRRANTEDGNAIAEPRPLRTWITLLVGFLVVGGLSAGIARLHVDAHVEALLPPDAESVQAAERMRTGSPFSNEFVAVEVDGLPALRRTVAALLRQPSVGRVESAAPFFPEDAAARQSLIARIPRPLPGMGRHTGHSAPHELSRSLRELAARARASSEEMRQVDANVLADRLRAIAAQAEALSAPVAQADAERLATFDESLGHDVILLRQAASRATPAPIELADLPDVLRARWTADGKYAIYVYPAGDLFAPGALDRFVTQTTSVHDHVVGYPVQLQRFLTSTETGLRRAVALALLLVAVILWLDFRRLGDALLALLPVAASLPATLGALGWLGEVLDVRLDLAGAAALPLLLGIGVDDGVHLVHRIRHVGAATAGARSVRGALILTTLTTIAGFGTIGFAPHRGMQSFAEVMVIGSVICLASTLVLVPAIRRVFPPPRVSED